MMHSNHRGRILAICFLFAFFSTAISSQYQEKFPSPDQLRMTNVNLEVKGYEFAAGMRKNEQGKPNLVGTEMVEVQKAGSGFLVKSDGTILTNFHVAKRVLEGLARFEDGSFFEVTHISAYDPVNDIAVLKVRANKAFSTVKLGNSDTLNIMDKILAVGNTLGEGMAVTEGIVNQIRVDDNGIHRQIRHSATIAPGNSGGALYRGNEVIGINVAIRPPYDISYAIPINLAKPLLNLENQWVPLRQAFPTDSEAIMARAKLIFAQTDQVPASQGEDTPGGKAYFINVSPLDDIVLALKAPPGHLVLAATDVEGSIIGLSADPKSETTILAISDPGNYQVGVAVMNFGQTPSNFGLTAFRIEW